jgi:hypothetical protein
MNQMIRNGPQSDESIIEMGSAESLHLPTEKGIANHRDSPDAVAAATC